MVGICVYGGREREKEKKRGKCIFYFSIKKKYFFNFQKKKNYTFI